MSEAEDLNEVNLAVESVPAYQRVTSSGTVVQVKGYVRTDNSAVTDRAKHSPGRPSMAASSGRFPGDRAIPVWPDAGKTSAKQTKDSVSYEGIEETGVVDQAILDEEVPVALEIMKGLPQNSSMKKLISILSSVSSASLSDDPPFDPNVIELAMGVVRVTGYSYVSKKTGKVVRVDPYTQMRRLITGLGGMEMAARKGITPDLLDKAFPGYQMKERTFKATDKTPTSLRSISPSRLSKKDQKLLTELNNLPIDREISIPAPRGATADMMKRAMTEVHPTAAIRNAKEGSRVVRGNESWERATDGLWYKLPRRNSKGIDDKEFTRRLISKAGNLQLTQGKPVSRKTYPMSNVDLDGLNQNSRNYADAMRFSKALTPVFNNIPEGVADSINGNLDFRRVNEPDSKSFPGMTRVTSTKTNDFYPKMAITINPDMEADLMSTLPKQQRSGYNVQTPLHPLETLMAGESATYISKLLDERAPSDMVDRMYARFNRIYDKNIKSDDGDYSGMSGRAGWIARINGERPEELTDEISEKLSVHGTRSSEAFLAEAWTEYVGSAAPRDLSAQIGRAFQDTMDEFSDYLFKNNWVDASEIPERTYTRNREANLTNKLRDAVDGDSIEVHEVNLAPRDLRSVLTSNEKYVNISDEFGNPKFVATVWQEGDVMGIEALDYPMLDPEDMDNGVPGDYLPFVMSSIGDRQYESPLEIAYNPATRQKTYADYINKETALQTLAAIEEHQATQGISRIEVSPRAGEDSVLYAQADYLFDPDATDVAEISAMLGDIQDLITIAQKDAGEGYFIFPKTKLRQLKTQANKMQRNLAADPATWPTPKQISDLGRFDEVGTSPGDIVMNRYSWSGVKQLKNTEAVTPPKVTASELGEAARAIDGTEISNFSKGMTPILDKIAARHADNFPNAKTSVTGNKTGHRLTIKDGNGKNIADIQVDVDETDGTVRWSNQHAPANRNEAILSFDLTNHLENVYQESNLKRLVQTADAEDPVGGYALATQGYDWSDFVERMAIQDKINEAVDQQIEQMEAIYVAAASVNARGSSTEDLVNQQARARQEVEEVRSSLQAQAAALMQKFDDDPMGPTPFELSQFGKAEAYEASNRARATGVRFDSNSNTFLPVYGEGQTPGELTSDERREQWLRERKERLQGGLVQQMLDIDGDATHDSFIEFAGKQLLTFGQYDMFKTLEGYWDWATDSTNPSLRKYSVGLLFMLIRLLPAGVGRGALLSLTNKVTKKIKSSNPEDWPSQAEIDSLLSKVKEKIPQETLDKLGNINAQSL